MRACARECAARERVCTARKHSHAHAPPPRRRKAQRRDVSHCFRKSRLVTAAWRCTRPLTPRAGAPAVKAVAVVVRMASIVRGTESATSVIGASGDVISSGHTPPQSTVRCQARRAGVPVMRPREHAAPGCAVRQDGRVHEHLVGRRRLEDAPAPQTRRIWPANLARQAPWPEAGRTYHLGAAPGSPWRC